jgi:hypothetical protein
MLAWEIPDSRPFGLVGLFVSYVGILVVID